MREDTGGVSEGLVIALDKKLWRFSMVKAGDKLKKFKLRDQHGVEFDSSKAVGKKILLSFHPLAWTRVCSRQMKSLERNRAALEKLNTVALGVSVDSVPSKYAWAKKLKIEDTRLLADFWPHGGLAAALGIFREKDGYSERANIIVNEKGKIVFVKVYPIKELPDIKELLKLLGKK